MIYEMLHCSSVIKKYNSDDFWQGLIRANTSELRVFNTERPHTDGITLKTDTVLNDKTSEIERDLCAFGLIAGDCPSSYLIALLWFD